MIVEELVAELGFDFDDKDLKKFDKGMNTAKKLLVGVGVAAVAGAVSIFKFTESIAETNDELGKQAKILGITTAQLQEWQFAAELGGGSAASMATALESVSKKASEAARGIGAGVEVFGILGISATTANGQIKGSSELLEEVADRVSELDSQAQKLEFLEKLGISSDLLLTLDQGSAALRKQRLEAEQLGFTLSEGAAKDAAEFNDELLRVNKIAGGVANAIGQELMPAITQMLTAFKEWFIANKDIIKQNILGFLESIKKGITVIWTIAKRLFNVINTLATAFGGWKVTIMAVGTALLILNAKALLLPLVFIAIGIAIALLVEDMITFFQGGESAIGDLVAKFPLLGAALEGLKFILEVIAESFQRVFDGTIIDKFVESFKIIKKAIIDSLLVPISAVSDALSSLTDFEVSNPFSTGGSLDFLNPNAGQAQQLQGQAITSNNQTVSSPMTNNVEINVTGAGDGATVATNIRQEMDTWFSNINKQAARNLKGTVAR